MGHLIQKQGEKFVLVSKGNVTQPTVTAPENMFLENITKNNVTYTVDSSIFAMNQACHKCVDLRDKKIRRNIFRTDRKLRRIHAGNFTELLSAQVKATKNLRTKMCRRCCGTGKVRKPRRGGRRRRRGWGR